MKELIKKLTLIQSELKAKKSQWNSFGNYHYRKAEDILEALKPLLKEQELFLSLSDEMVFLGNRFYVKATACVTDGENEKFVTSYAREEETKKGMDGSQITGAASSYARKYALNGLFGIDDTADSDATNDHGKSENKNSETTKKEQPKTPKDQIITNPKQQLLNPAVPLWKTVVDRLEQKNITSDKWPEIKRNYIISDADELALFKILNWIKE